MPGVLFSWRVRRVTFFVKYLFFYMQSSISFLDGVWLHIGILQIGAKNVAPFSPIDSCPLFCSSFCNFFKIMDFWKLSFGCEPINAQLCKCRRIPSLQYSAFHFSAFGNFLSWAFVKKVPEFQMNSSHGKFSFTMYLFEWSKTELVIELVASSEELFLENWINGVDHLMTITANICT